MPVRLRTPRPTCLCFVAARLRRRRHRPSSRNVVTLKRCLIFETVCFRENRQITSMSAVDFLSSGADVIRNQVLNLELTGAHLPSSADQSRRLRVNCAVLPKNGLRLTAGAARGARTLMRAQQRRAGDSAADVCRAEGAQSRTRTRTLRTSKTL